MAVTIDLTALTTGKSATDASSYATASVSPSPFQLVIAAIAVVSPTLGGTPPNPTVSGNGLTWVNIGHITTSLIDDRKLSVFRAMGAAPTAGAITFSYGGDTQSEAAWTVFQLNNVDIGGTSGATAVVQSATATGDAVASHILTVTLGAFESDNLTNATVGVFAANSGNNDALWTPGSGFTEIHERGQGAIGIMSEWKTTNDTTVDGDINQIAPDMCGIAFEVRAQKAPPVETVILQAVKRASEW